MRPQDTLNVSHSQQHHNPEGLPNIYAIASGKGGVGKTWFSITLAHALARKGKKVLIFDGDLGLANVDIQLGLTPARDLGSVAEGLQSLASVITPYPPGQFDVIAGRSGCGSLANLLPDKLKWLRYELTKLSPLYDCLLIDLGAGLDGMVRNLLPLAQKCLLVLTDEPTSITDAYAFIKIFHKSYPRLKFHILVNQADSFNLAEGTFQSFQKVCQRFLAYTPELLGIVHRDKYIKEAIRSQSSILTRHPNAPASLDVLRIASKIMATL